jgi:hypothetical protein
MSDPLVSPRDCPADLGADCAQVLRVVLPGVCRQFARQTGWPLDLLEECALAGLVTALETYDPSRGRRFSSWAALHLRWAILDEWRDKRDGWLWRRLPGAPRAWRPRRAPRAAPVTPDCAWLVEQQEWLWQMRQRVVQRGTPRLVGLFDALARGDRPSAIARAWGVSPPAIRYYVRQLQGLLRAFAPSGEEP